MKKIIKRTGPNGTFEGFVQVCFRHRMEPNPNRSIHNLKMTMRDVHIVKGEAETQTYASEEFYDVKDAVPMARKIEAVVTVALEKMANEPKEKEESVVENLKSLGYR